MPKNLVTICVLALSFFLFNCKQKEQPVIEESVLEEDPTLEYSLEDEPTLESVEEEDLQTPPVEEEMVEEVIEEVEEAEEVDVVEEAPAPKFDENGHYVLQVSVFKSYEMAQGLESKFKKLGFPAYIAAVESPVNELQGEYYRLRIGPFASVADAKSFGENTLRPMNYDFWVDNKSGDAVGKGIVAVAASATPELEEVTVEEVSPDTLVVDSVPATLDTVVLPVLPTVDSSIVAPVANSVSAVEPAPVVDAGNDSLEQNWSLDDSEKRWNLEDDKF
jgi:hypothetical protein